MEEPVSNNFVSYLADSKVILCKYEGEITIRQRYETVEYLFEFSKKLGIKELMIDLRFHTHKHSIRESYQFIKRLRGLIDEHKIAVIYKRESVFSALMIKSLKKEYSKVQGFTNQEQAINWLTSFSAVA